MLTLLNFSFDFSFHFIVDFIVDLVLVLLILCTTCICHILGCVSCVLKVRYSCGLFCLSAPALSRILLFMFCCSVWLINAAAADDDDDTNALRVYKGVSPIAH